MQASSYLNLSQATALIVDDNAQSLDLLAGVMTSFGMRSIKRAENGRAAMAAVQQSSPDLILTDGQMPEMDGYDFVKWLRRDGSDMSRITPAIIVTAHTRQADVLRARDCGANFIIAKPITPRVVLERIMWVARGDRMFIETETYAGPCRRYRNDGPPPDHPDGRRREDLSLELGAAKAPNLSQDELDQLVKPRKAF